MLDIYEKTVELLEKGEDFAIVTVIESDGSTPRGIGTKMILLKNRKTYGTIGGGCLESAAIEEGLIAIEEKKSKTVKYSLEEIDKGGIGMRCGGNIDLFIESINPSHNINTRIRNDEI